MTIKVYIDTNIFVYAIVKHPEFGSACATVLRDIAGGVFEAAGSRFVAIELLGSLASIDPVVARRATIDYLRGNLVSLDIDENVLYLAGSINEITNIKYDAVHASIMLLNGITTIITNDLDDWGKLKKDFDKIIALLKQQRIPCSVSTIDVVAPTSYQGWRAALKGRG